MPLLEKKEKISLEKKRHSLAHILAAAVSKLYPGTKFGTGPATENGFYYDIQVPEGKITESALEKIEQEMRNIIKSDLKFQKKLLSYKEALNLFKKSNQSYKIQLLKKHYRPNRKKEKRVSVYELGDFIDLCKGPHVRSTSEIDPKSFKLTKVSGVYWQGKENNPQLQRIQGLAFISEKDLELFLYAEQEAKKRDHRVLGLKLNLFHIDEAVGPGLILWHPKGATLKRIIENYVLEKYLENGYQLVNTPHIALASLWQTSGHRSFYRENMFPLMHMEELKTGEKSDYQIKPMNCPFHIAIYKSQIRSYRDLPIKYTELGTVYRYERSGVLHGLTRVRGFTQDDAHIFCTRDQLAEEIEKVLRLTKEILTKFDFKEYEVHLSTPDPKNRKKYLGSAKSWQEAEGALKQAIKSQNWDFQEDKGEAVFYGPKIDIKVADSLGRLWQISTVQIDFNLPEKFNIFFIDKKGKKKVPIMIHRALLGSLERFIGILIEHYAGAFPFWLSPVQAEIIPVSDKQAAYAGKVQKRLSENKIRTRINIKRETLSKRIREAQMQKIPYILVVGEKEEKADLVNLRSRNKGVLGDFSLSDALRKME